MAGPCPRQESPKPPTAAGRRVVPPFFVAAGQGLGHDAFIILTLARERLWPIGAPVRPAVLHGYDLGKSVGALAAARRSGGLGALRPSLHPPTVPLGPPPGPVRRGRRRPGPGRPHPAGGAA